MGEVYVVPDNQMPRRRQYGQEVPVQNAQQMLEQLTQSIQTHRAQNPVYSPFPAGTKTLEGKRFDYEQAADAAKQLASASRSSGSGGGGGTGTAAPGTKDERAGLATSKMIDAATDPQFTHYNQALDFLRQPQVLSAINRDRVDMSQVLNAVIQKHLGIGLDQFVRSRHYHPLFHGWIAEYAKEKPKDTPYSSIHPLMR